MIAQVVPITRIRRDTSWWSYTVPRHTSCAPGSLVVIPFRGRNELGIVWHLEDRDEKASKPLGQVITAAPLLRQPHRQLVELLSEQGLCSLSTALYQWLPKGLRSLPLSKVATDLLANYQPGSTAPKQHGVIVPFFHPTLAESLNQKFGSNFYQYFAESSERQELEQWFRILKGETRVVMGRERALFAPWANLQRLTLFEPENVAYYHEQSPYLHLLGVAEKLAAFTQAELILKTYLPSEAAKQLWPGTIESLFPPCPPVEVIPLGKQPLLNVQVVDRVTAALNQGEVVILYNAHDQVSIQHENQERVLIPGIETLRKRWESLVGSEAMKHLHLDTRQLFHKKYEKVSLCVVLSLDPLTHTSIFSNLLHGIADLAQLLTYQAPLLIQSSDPSHPLADALCRGQLSSYVSTLIQEQQQANLPPFGQQIACSLPASETSDTQLTQLHEKLSPLVKAPWSLSHPFVAPWRKKAFSHLLISTPLPQARLAPQVRSQLLTLSRPWRIQHNPWYLL